MSNEKKSKSASKEQTKGIGKTKKILLCIASILVACVLTLMITLSCIKVNVYVEAGKPYQINIYNHSTVATKTFKEDSTEYEEVLKRFKNITKTSAFSRLINGLRLDNKKHLDTTGKFAKWTTSINADNYVVEFVYTKEQDVVVYQGKNTRVLSYFAISFVLPETDDLDEIIVYHSTTNETANNKMAEEYAECLPFSVYGNTKSFRGYINSI